MKHLLLPIVLLAVASAVPSQAQIGLYAGFTSSKLDVVNSDRTNGGTFGAFYDRAHFPLINFGVDLRGVVVNSNQYSKVTSVTAGPRAVVHLPIVPLRPYVEGLVGGAHAEFGQGIAAQKSNSFAAGFAAGADLHILPWIDWRVLDYSYTRLVGSHTSQNSLTTGIVFRIPFS